jgi:hypothetical protein
MSPAPARHIIVASPRLPDLAWLVIALREAGHAVFEVRDGEGIVGVANTLDTVDLLIADPETPCLTGHALPELLTKAKPDLPVLYWPDHDPQAIAKLAALLPDSASGGQ